MRRADVFLFERLAGRIVETDDGQCQFAYDADYMKDPGAELVSPTMPFRNLELLNFKNKKLQSFFNPHPL